MNIILLGYTGKLGSAIFRRLSQGPWTIHTFNSGNINIFSPDKLFNTLDSCAPQVIINAIGFNGIASCEENHDKAVEINTHFPSLLAKYSAKNNVTLIHFSTDAVFGVSKNEYFTEDDIPDPINSYGNSKYHGELEISTTSDNFYIFRLPLLFGCHQNNNQLFEKMVLSLNANKQIICADDFYTTPTYTAKIADYIYELILNRNLGSGIYHLSSIKRCSIHEFMSYIANKIRKNEQVVPGSYKLFNTNLTVNNNGALKSVKIVDLGNWKDNINHYLSSLKLTAKK